MDDEVNAVLCGDSDTAGLVSLFLCNCSVAL